jgi:hypothetical protein
MNNEIATCSIIILPGCIDYPDPNETKDLVQAYVDQWPSQEL